MGVQAAQLYLCSRHGAAGSPVSAVHMSEEGQGAASARRLAEHKVSPVTQLAAQGDAGTLASVGCGGERLVLEWARSEVRDGGVDVQQPSLAL